MTGPAILICEDDASVRSMLVRGLRKEGFAAEGVADGEAFLARLRTSAPDLLVIDIGLPDSDGRELCQTLRAEGVKTPVLFLTAHADLTDRLAGFSAGGDDYLGKPFDWDELCAHLRALLRRTTVNEQPDGALALDPLTHSVSCEGTVVHLAPTEFRLLACMMARGAKGGSRQTLIAGAWPAGAHVSANTLDSYVSRLRRKLSRLPQGPRIEAMRGVGYRLLSA